MLKMVNSHQTKFYLAKKGGKIDNLYLVSFSFKFLDLKFFPFNLTFFGIKLMPNRHLTQPYRQSLKKPLQQKEKQPTHLLPFKSLQNVKQDTNCHSWKLC